MLKFYKLLFFSSLMFGSLISISSYSWMSMWLGLEINLLSMIPLLKDANNIYPSEAALKYFIIQVLASLILMFSIIMSLNLIEFFPNNYFSNLMIIMNSAFFIKMGAAPFHAWFPEVMEGISWFNGLLMLTWQKIAPMILLMNNLKMNFFFFYIIVISSLIGGIQGLNQVSLRKIMAYSSISHIGWMISNLMTSSITWIIYFFIYSIITINIIMILKYLNIFYLKQLFNLMNSNKMFHIFFCMNFFSLGGLPPFLGFFPKWLTINIIIQNYFILLSLLLILTTLITLYFYIRLTFSSLTLYKNESFLNVIIYNNYFIMIYNVISILGLSICTLVFNFY